MRFVRQRIRGKQPQQQQQRLRQRCSILRRPAASVLGTSWGELRCSKLLARFAELHGEMPYEVPPTEAVREFRGQLLQLASSRTHKVACVAISLLLYSEALSCEGTPSDQRVMVAGARERLKLIERIGRARWDGLRVSGNELLVSLRSCAEPTARRLSVLSRLVSMASGWKHGAPSAELTELRRAVAAALQQASQHGGVAAQCAVCLNDWGSEDSAIVLKCLHAVHTDCFWGLMMSHHAAAYRGRCRTCKADPGWGRLARSNIRCSVASALAASVVSAYDSEEFGAHELDAWMPPFVAKMCERMGSELPERTGAAGAHAAWREVDRELKRRCWRRPLGFAAAVRGQLPSRNSLLSTVLS